MAMHRDNSQSNPSAWSHDFARSYEDAFGHHPSQLDAGGARRRTPAADGGAVIDQMTAAMHECLAEVEQRHADALREMQTKFTRMTGSASRARPAVPPELTQAFGRIEQGMANLAHRIADAAPERRRAADAFVFGVPKAEATHFVFNAKPHQPVAPVAIDPPGGRDPWDDDQAEALAALYESGQTGFAVPPRRVTAVSLVEVPAAPIGADRDWLEARLSGLTEHVAKSIEAARPGAALTTLMDRVDQLESRFGSALGDLVTKSDLDAMRLAQKADAKPDVMPAVLGALEAQIKDLAGHIDATHQQLSRLDAIERHLSDLQAFAQASVDASAEAEVFEPAPPAPTAMEIAALAEQAVERALAKMPAPVMAQPLTDPAIGAASTETQNRIDAVHGLLNEFAAERRRGEQQTSGVLETVQEALIRLIDRVDAIETAKQETRASAAPQAVPAMQAAVETVAQLAPAAPAALAQAPRRRDARRIDAVVADELHAADTPEAHAPVQPQIDIKDVAVKARRVAITPAQQPAAAAADDEQPELAAKPARKARPAPAAASGSGRRGIMVAAVALGLVGVSYVASLLLADRYGAIPTGGIPSAMQPKSQTPPPQAKPAAVQGQAPAATPPGMVGEPVRAAPATVTQQADPNYRAPNVNSRTKRRGDEKDESAVRTPRGAQEPETVEDDLSRLENDTLMQDALPASAETLRESAARKVSSVTVAPGMALVTPATAQMGLAPYAQRQASLAAMSERLGQQARPATDFSGRFGNTATSPVVTGSNPAVKPQPVSAGVQPAAPQAPIETAVTENVSETAEMPPALVGPLSLRTAAAKGDPSAAFEVATRLAEGRGIKQDFKLALVWYQRAANKGFVVAQYRLGTLYERGLGTPVDINRARTWYKRAADQGNIKAMHNMAVLSAGNGGAAPDYVAAAKWFKEAADRGLADSQFNLGVLNESGLGVAKDLRAAYLWFSLAARGGDTEAARRRDILLAQLDAATLKTADEQVRGWRARPSDVRLNDARVAGDQWRLQAQGQNEPAALPLPVPPEPTAPPAAPAITPKIIKAPGR